MDILLILGVIALGVVLIGMLLGRIAWERGAVLLMVLIVVVALTYFLLGRMRFG